jgi:hypothetical protein
MVAKVASIPSSLLLANSRIVGEGGSDEHVTKHGDATYMH